MKTVTAIRIFAAAALATAGALLGAAAYAAGTHGGGHGHGFAFGEPGKPAEVTRTIDVTMKENFFEPETIEVKPGETIRFRIANQGELVHEFNIGTAAMHAEHQKEMATMMEHGALKDDRIDHAMMKMDMGGGRTMEHDDPNAVLLEPGKSGEVIWKFGKAMALDFACTVPGHYEAGMVGRMHVR